MRDLRDETWIVPTSQTLSASLLLPWGELQPVGRAQCPWNGISDWLVYVGYSNFACHSTPACVSLSVASEETLGVLTNTVSEGSGEFQALKFNNKSCSCITKCTCLFCTSIYYTHCCCTANSPCVKFHRTITS
jgi:hypothetical protein